MIIRTQLTKQYLMLFCLSIAACSTAPSVNNIQNSRNIETSKTDSMMVNNVGNHVGNDIVPLADERGTANTPRVQYFDGTGAFRKSSPATVSPIIRRQQGGVNLKFRDADIKTLLDAVLSDTLGLRYVLAPGIQGKFSLDTSGSVSEKGLLYILETVLKTRDVALVKTADGYHVLPAGEAPRRSGVKSELPASKNLPGFTLQIVPLKHTVPSQMRKVLEPFAPRGGIVSSDDSRNMLILAGTRQEITSMLETIETFDVDWMEGMSFALYELEYVKVEALAKELLQIFADAESPIAGAVRLIPIPRLNRLLAISAQPAYLREVKTWISRLDLGGSTPGRRLYVYQVQNGRATDLAQSLNKIFGYGNSEARGNAFESPTSKADDYAESKNIKPLTQNKQSVTGGVLSEQSSSQNNNDFGSMGKSGVRIVPTEENNSLLIFAAPREFSVIKAGLKQLDEAPRQVLIEASLAEVTLTDELRYGIQWFFDSDNDMGTLSETSGGGLASAFPGFSYVYSGSSNVRAVLNALESVTDVNIISSPKLLVLNNHSAMLRIGDEVPVPKQSSVGTSGSNAPIVNSIEYRETGVILSVTPRINQSGLIYLDVVQEVSSVAETTSSGIDAPTIQQRKIESTVAIQNGETIALGGLIRESDSVAKAGLPILQNIPVLGKLFGRNSMISRRTELVIFLTPRVIRNTQETRDVMDYLKGVFSNIRPLQEL